MCWYQVKFGFLPALISYCHPVNILFEQAVAALCAVRVRFNIDSVVLLVSYWFYSVPRLNHNYSYIISPLYAHLKLILTELYTDRQRRRIQCVT